MNLFITNLSNLGGNIAWSVCLSLLGALTVAFFVGMIWESWRGVFGSFCGALALSLFVCLNVVPTVAEEHASFKSEITGDAKVIGATVLSLDYGKRHAVLLIDTDSKAEHSLKGQAVTVGMDDDGSLRILDNPWKGMMWGSDTLQRMKEKAGIK